MKADKLLVVLALWFSTRAAAQNRPLIDSLSRVAQHQSDSLKVWTLTNLDWEWRPYNRNKALGYAQQALAIARQRNDMEQIGYCWMAIGNVYMYHRNSAEALAAYQQAQHFFRRTAGLSRKARLAQANYNLGLLYQEQLNDNVKSAASLLEAAAWYTQANDWEGVTNCYTNIAHIHKQQHRYDQADELYQKAIQAARKSGIAHEILVLNDYYSSYLERYRQLEQPQLLTEAVIGFQKAIRLCQEHADQLPPQYLPTLQANLGECYVLQNKLTLANQLLTESIRLAKPIHYDLVLPTSYSQLAVIAFRQGRTQVARNHLAEVEKLLPALGWQDQQSIAQALVALFVEQRQWADAYQWQKRYQAVSDSLTRREQTATVAALQTQFNVKQKDEAIASLEQAASAQRRMLMLAVALGVSLLALVVVVFRWLRTQKKLNEQQKKVFALELSQKERELVSNSIHIAAKNNLLHELKTELRKTPNQKPTLRLIDQNLQTDESLEAFRRQFEGIHPSFFQTLQSYSPQPLSATELRYCAYLRLGLATKEMASLLNIDPPSVRVAKYRLRQKLNLSKDTSLDEFLRKL